MKCPDCGTVNEDYAIFCKNCGVRLQEGSFKEKIEEKVYSGTVEDDMSYQQNNTDINDDSGYSGWWACCICLVAIFIIFAIFAH